jgi:ParB family chromosome partitioning protein
MNSATQPAKQPEIDPKLLHANPWNTNRCNPEMEHRIEQSIKRLGVFKPVIVRELPNGSLQIIGGQHRVEAAVRLKIKSIPFFSVGQIADNKAKEIGIVDNGRYGEDDTLQLAELLESLGTADDLATFMPYSDNEFASIFASTNIALDDLDLPDDADLTPSVPTAKAPQTHQIMRFKVPMGDVSVITSAIEKVMKQQGFTEEDSLANAGNALVHVFNKAGV